MSRDLVLVAALVAGLTVVIVASAQPARVEPTPVAQSVTVTGGHPDGREIATWVYQLQRYQNDRLDEIEAAPHDLAVVDLARDAGSDWFTQWEVERVRRSGKVVLAYLSIGSIEDYRPEVDAVRASPERLVLNRWEDWPQEHFVRYWEEDWWALAVRPRLDQALSAGFDGVYLDTPLAYEELDSSLVGGTSRTELAQRMVALIRRISEYAKQREPAFLVVPQNSPELRTHPGYLEAVDGIAMEGLFVRPTDKPCVQDWCAGNLAHTRAIREAGKLVLAVDYADRPDLAAATCRRYAEEGFAGYIGPVELDEVRPPPC